MPCSKTQFALIIELRAPCSCKANYNQPSIYLSNCDWLRSEWLTLVNREYFPWVADEKGLLGGGALARGTLRLLSDDIGITCDLWLETAAVPIGGGTVDDQKKADSSHDQYTAREMHRRLNLVGEWNLLHHFVVFIEHTDILLAGRPANPMKGTTSKTTQ